MRSPKLGQKRKLTLKTARTRKIRSDARESRYAKKERRMRQKKMCHSRRERRGGSPSGR
jgi:hypothetical protein